MAIKPLANGTNDKADHESRLVTVLVTGFGPFQSRYPVNPSFEIARSLPQLLPRSSVDCDAVKIIGYGSPIRVCYAEARELVPALLEGYENTIDLVLHIGMASGRTYYTAERYAHRDDYTKHKDLDGQMPPPGEAEERFSDCPEMLETSLDCADVVQRWQKVIAQMPQGTPAHGADCRSSENAGRFLCDYTYFNSLAWYARRSGKYMGGKSSDRPVMFLHVPAESDEETLAKGQAVATALIHAMVESYVGSRSD